MGSILFITSHGLEPFSAGLAVGGGMVLSALWSSRDVVVCQFKECCGKPWIRPNVSMLEQSLSQNVFGQHLVHSLVTRSIRAHLRKEEPKKALVMSFHGWTGAGKNFELQIRSRRRNLQHRSCTRLLWSFNLPIRFIQQLSCFTLLLSCMASCRYLVNCYGY